MMAERSASEHRFRTVMFGMLLLLLLTLALCGEPLFIEMFP